LRAINTPVRLLSEIRGERNAALSGISTLGLILAAAYASWRGGYWPRVDALAIMLTVVPIASLAALDLTRSTGNMLWIRYLTPALPGVILLCVGLFSSQRIASHVAPAVLVLLCVASLIVMYRTPYQEDWREKVARIKEVSGDGPIVIRMGDAPDWIYRLWACAISHYGWEPWRTVILKKEADGAFVGEKIKPGIDR
jgi:uncharacterized membrane protein YfcA